MGAYRTPIIDKLKKDSATFYTFGSSIEDIGLNINEKTNKVALSHYVLLNIPYISDNAGGSGTFAIDNFFNDKTISKKEAIIKNGGDYIFPKLLQNYALNFETILRNKGTYDYSSSQTVSEKTFWKFLQKSGALKFVKYTDDEGNNFYHEDFTSPDSMVIKGFGQIATSSQVSNTYNMNNETYIMIPSSYGQMKYYMTEAFDSNYEKNKSYSLNSISKLEGFSASSETEPTDFPISDENNTYSTKSPFDGLQFEFDIEDIKKHLAYENNLNLIDLDRISYDNLAYDSSLCLGSKYSFNTILVYYTIYDSLGNSIATNLFGAMVLDSAEDISENQESQTNTAFEIKFDSSILSSELSNIANYGLSNNTLYGNPTSEFNLNGQATSNLYLKNDYVDDKQKIIGKSIELTFKTSKLEGLALQFIDGTTTDLTSAFDVTDTDLPDFVSVTKVQGDAKNDIYYKVKYTSEEYLRNAGIRFTNKNTSTTITINLVSMVINDLSHYPSNKGLGIKESLYKIPSYLKTQTKEGSFGSEYSFRLNIQTASIYDKNSQIIDYSSGTQAIIDDFSGVLYNLRVAIDVLKSNSVVQAKLYNDFQSMKTLTTNALSKVDIIEKDINNIMHGNARIISADELSANSIETKSINGNLSFLDSSKNEVGKIENDTLYFDNIETKEFTPSIINLSEVIVGNEGVNFKKDGEVIFAINNNGELMANFQDASFSSVQSNTGNFASLEGTTANITFVKSNTTSAILVDASHISTPSLENTRFIQYDSDGLHFISPSGEEYNTHLSVQGNLSVPNISYNYLAKNWYLGIYESDEVVTLYKINNIYALLNAFIESEELLAEGASHEDVEELQEVLYVNYKYVDRFISKYAYIFTKLLESNLPKFIEEGNIQEGTEVTAIDNMALLFNQLNVNGNDYAYVCIDGGISQTSQREASQNSEYIGEMTRVTNIISFTCNLTGECAQVHIHRELDSIVDLDEYASEPYIIKSLIY